MRSTFAYAVRRFWALALAVRAAHECTAQPMEGAWSTLQGSVARNGTLPYAAASPCNGQMSMQVNTTGQVRSSPAVGSDGTVYVGTNASALLAYAANGTPSWRYQTIKGVLNSPSLAADGTVYVNAEDLNLYALYPNGTLKWAYEMFADQANAPAIGPDGTLYTACGRLGVAQVALCAITPSGQLAWSLPEYQPTGPLAIDSSGTLYVPVSSYSDGVFLSAVSTSGTPLWNASLPLVHGTPYYPVAGVAPTVSGSTVYLVTTNGCCSTPVIVAVDMLSGNISWNVTVNELKQGISCSQYWISGIAVSPDGQTLYTVCTAYNGGGGYVLAVSASTGTLKWGYPTFGSMLSVPAVAPGGNAIYVGSGDGNMYAISNEGQLLWHYATGGPVYSSPAIGPNGQVIVGSDDGSVYFFCLSSLN
jgi:outer membrane protein assembly factor BamB